MVGVSLEKEALAGDDKALAAHNMRILDRVNASGKVFLSHTKLGERYVLRVAIGNLKTQESHLAEAWALLRRAGEIVTV